MDRSKRHIIVVTSLLLNHHRHSGLPTATRSATRQLSATFVSFSAGSKQVRPLLHRTASKITTRFFNPTATNFQNIENESFENKVDSDSDDEIVCFAPQENSELVNPSSEFATSYHAPVMWKECVEALLSGESSTSGGKSCQRVFVDGTLGGGGHSQALLESLSGGDILIGCDVDQDALNTASNRLALYMQPSISKPLFLPIHLNFSDLRPQLLYDLLSIKCSGNVEYSSYVNLIESCNEEKLLKVDGILLDLGVSSYQINTPERGFAFMKDGPLDMRMNVNDDASTAFQTAADLCNNLDFAELRRILQAYGDEPRSKAIAHAIIERRPLCTTGDLHKAVAAVTPEYAKRRRLGRIATLARVFQALRIAVNKEDAALEKALVDMAPKLLRPGGRLAVLSYHSLEDKATKRVLRDGALSKHEANIMNQQKDMFGNYIGEPKLFKMIGKALKATDEEVLSNVRARSATLRVAERLS